VGERHFAVLGGSVAGMATAATVLDSDETMQRRIEELFGEIAKSPRPAAGPSRDDMLALTSAAITGVPESAQA
jgi:hypothetical protein